MRKTAFAALLAAAIATPAAAQPAPDPTRDDLRCVIAVGMFAAQARNDADTKLGAAAGLGFFIGRLKGREPGIDLKARVLAEANRLKSPADLQPDLARCGGEMQAISDESNALGAALKAFADNKARQGG
jgi:hypothetical protein